MVSQRLIEILSEAAAYAEGFYTGANDVPVRANNPCDLTDDGDVGYGVIQTAGPDGAKITIYPNIQAGWNAAYKKFGRMLNGESEVYPITLSLIQIGMKYSGNSSWGLNVASRLETLLQVAITPLTTLKDLANLDAVGGV